MGLTILPEIKLARKIHEKHKLTIPFDLNDLVSQYATVHYKNIPIDGVDGICLNLKNPRKRTKVIVNSSTPLNRQRFTLAHELGHIIIPWHLGTIIDDLQPDKANLKYWKLESEANRFASELLMPFNWLLSMFLKNNNIQKLIKFTASSCFVSLEAARIRIDRFWDEAIDYLIPKSVIEEKFDSLKSIGKVHEKLIEQTPFHPLYVAQQIVKSLNDKFAFCVEKDDTVIGCGCSKNAHGFYQEEGSRFISAPYPLFNSYEVCEYFGIKTHWWNLDVNHNLNEDDRSWQELLDQLARDLVPDNQIKKFKSSINGVISGTNGSWKRKHPERNVEEFIIEIMSRYNNIDDKEIFTHPNFAPFVRKRCTILYTNSI